MYSVITTAPSNEVLAAVSGPRLGNKQVRPVFRYAGSEEGKDAVIVTVEDWAGAILTAALRKMGAWFDRVAPQGRIPSGRPIITHAGASSIRNQRKVDGLARKDRAIRRAMKGADA